MLITGGGGGVGRQLALNFARLRARVVIWDINKDGKFVAPGGGLLVHKHKIDSYFFGVRPGRLAD